MEENIERNPIYERWINEILGISESQVNKLMNMDRESDEFWDLYTKVGEVIVDPQFSYDGSEASDQFHKYRSKVLDIENGSISDALRKTGNDFPSQVWDLCNIIDEVGW